MKRRHVYSPPKGNRFSRTVIAVLGGLFCGFFVFYFIPLLQKLESRFAGEDQVVEAVEIAPPPPEEFQAPDEIPPDEPEEEPEPELADEDASLDIEPLDINLSGAGAGGTVIEIAPKFNMADQMDMFESADLDSPPKPATRFPPRYPDKLKRKKVQGRVLVSAVVDEKGIVTETSIKQSSGHKELDDAAEKALKRWKFKPGKKGNDPVKCQIVQPISFKLNNA